MIQFENLRIHEGKNAKFVSTHTSDDREKIEDERKKLLRQWVELSMSIFITQFLSSRIKNKFKISITK